MSAKSIVSKKTSVLSKQIKVACLRTRYYEFYKRLEFKCSLTRTNFRYVNEAYTSKTCSNCGNYNNKLKEEIIYECKLIIHRDMNGSRNIMIKSLF